MSELRPAAWVIAAVGNHLPPDAWRLGNLPGRCGVYAALLWGGAAHQPSLRQRWGKGRRPADP